MLNFCLWTQVEQRGPRRFRARVMAIPYGIEQRVAPEERVALAQSREKADAEAARLAKALARDIRARGHRVLSQSEVPA